MRAVVDPNVLISALLSSGGSPAAVLRAWLDGAYELVVSPALLAELRRALAYPKLAVRIGSADADAFIGILERNAEVRSDPGTSPAVRCPDPDDVYLIALAADAGAILVSGDRHLLGLADALPVLSPADFLGRLSA